MELLISAIVFFGTLAILSMLVVLAIDNHRLINDNKEDDV